MFKRIYAKIKDFITDNYLILLFYLITYLILTYPLPYYIYTEGGIIDVNSRIEVKDKTKSKGSYNLCFVSQLKATIPTYLLSYIKKDWEVVKVSDVVLDSSESDKDVIKRDKLYLDDSNISALETAFKLANKEYKIESTHPIILYVLKEANTNLSIGDEIISIDETLINTSNDITNYLKDKDINTKLNLKIKHNNKTYSKYATIISYNGEKIIGISLLDKKTITTNPEVTFKFKDNEGGPSGGFINSLALYDYLVDEDISKGLKIAGTGTIDSNGDVGEIGGVKYKLKGAVKNKADIFFVPSGENYDEAIKYAKKKNYNIKIIGVSNIEDAIKYLKNI